MAMQPQSPAAARSTSFLLSASGAASSVPSTGVVPSSGGSQAGAWPAQRVAEVVRWDGIVVEGVQVSYAGNQVPALAAAARRACAGPVAHTGDSDWSGDDLVPDEFEVTGSHMFGGTKENVAALRSMHDLQMEHAHNPNLVKQFGELSVSFKAWRPVRGDGNCYYRAVLFAWLERSVAIGNLDCLRAFDNRLRQHRHAPQLGNSIRICHGALRGWIAKRQACSSESEVKALLADVANEFNKERSDRAWILCLRHLIAQYLRKHAHDPMSDGSGGDSGNVLTYESWATAISGAKNIDDYCEQHVYVMNKDAADHVQHVCPRVLKTVVRICMVDRQTANCQFIDYGKSTSVPAVSAGESVGSAAQLASVNLGHGAAPEIFLLLKPGHYDILVPQNDEAAKLLDAAGTVGVARGGVADNESRSKEQMGDPSFLRSHSDARWRSLIKVTRELCATFSSVVECLENKLVEELEGKRKRLGSMDETLFEGQLTSLLDPLREALRRFQYVPEDSAFSQERRLAAEPPPLLVALQAFFHQCSKSRSVSPVRPAAVARGGLPVATPVPVAAVASNAAPSLTSAATPAALAPAAVAPAAPAVQQQPRAADLECCICMQQGAAARAGCGCAYHPTCLSEYAAMEGRPASEICCHLHDQPLGSSFVAQLAEVRGGTLSEHRVVAAKPSLAVGEAPGSTPGAGAVPPASMVAMMPPATRIELSPPKPASRSPDAGRFLTVPRSMARIPESVRQMPRTGNLGAALGIPCVICFGEDGVLKTLHCGYKVHKSCLKTFWSGRVTTLCRFTNIRCPAEVAGCSSDLVEEDLRGVVDAADLQTAERSVRDVDALNKKLIEDLRRQNEEYRPMFQCAICLVEHEVEGCCTLPCQHRFCFEALQYHFDIIVRERRLNKLMCPADGCGFNLRSEEFIHIFQQCLSEESYVKLHEFLTRDNPNIHECPTPGCEEKVFLDDGDDFADLACPRGHRFCGKCQLGPHPGISCEEREEQLQRERREEEVQRDQAEAWRSALALGWKPCPKRCRFGGGYKAAEECDHVTCECGFEFCWDCGVERQVALVHDNRWHKPSCRYHTRPDEVAEAPVFMPQCPECKKMPNGMPCRYPRDDGYPDSYISRSHMRHRTH